MPEPVLDADVQDDWDRDSMVTCLDLFSDSVQRHAQSVALHTQSRSWSYVELNERSNCIANLLSARGLERGDRVVLNVQDSPEYIAALLGIWKCGLVAVPLNAQSPDRDIDRAIRFCGAKAWVTSKRARAYAGSMHEILVVVVDEDECFDGRETHDWSDTELRVQSLGAEGDLALLVNTSGTTGEPKAVQLTHSNLSSNVSGIVRYLELSDRDRILTILPFSYVYGNSVLLTSLVVGAELFLGASMVFPQQVVNQLREFSITGFSGVPATYRMLLAQTDFTRKPFPELRFLTQAGGPMSHTEVVELLGHMDPKPRFYIMYGQTEATARLTWLPPDDIGRKTGSVGVPVQGVEITVRDIENRELPSNVVGEVCARGPNVMSGYWKNPDATARTLKGGWLHTGDLGYLDADGYLYLQGRNSDMIKAGAHRINPAEIEEVVREIPGLGEVVAVGVPDELLGERILLVIEGAEPSGRSTEILRHCRMNLPPYKMPKEIRWVSSLPRTHSGKIKRSQLREMES